MGFFSGIWKLTDAKFVGNRLQEKIILHNIEKSTIYILIYQCSDCPQAFAAENVLESHRYHHHNQSGRGKKRERANLLTPGLQRIDESPRWITQQKTTELPLLVNKKCGNLTQQQTDIEFNFKIWKSGIYLISIKSSSPLFLCDKRFDRY